ncbi:Holliday junction resolvase RuvX [Candidatus Dependentiae bacterium]|nr:Holliday junction resolvase RuvX [Candidatus Dependentiae bacterium]
MAENKKILALDIGDQWTGIAISDSSQTFVKPFTTVSLQELKPFLTKILTEQEIDTIVVGRPITLKGTISKQTEKVIKKKEELENEFKQVKWVLWDERLTSKWADELKKGISKEEKLKSHARAAAFILDSYLMFLKIQAEKV